MLAVVAAADVAYARQQVAGCTAQLRDVRWRERDEEIPW